VLPHTSFSHLRYWVDAIPDLEKFIGIYIPILENAPKGLYSYFWNLKALLSDVRFIVKASK
jgi:hypothetical protein